MTGPTGGHIELRTESEKRGGACQYLTVSSLPERLSAGPVELHRYDLGRLDAFIEAVEASYTELHLWMSWAQVPPVREDLARRIGEDVARFESDEAWQYFLVDPGSRDVVGGAGLRRTERDEMAIGYWVRTDRTRRGYARAAARSLTSAAFASPLSVARVEISMDRDNCASRAVAENLGFHLREERDREERTPGQTGKGQYWTMERATWALLEETRRTCAATNEAVRHH